MAHSIINISPARSNTASNALFVASLLTYLAALALPAYRTGYNDMRQIQHGYEALLFGPLGILVGQISWFANPFLLAAWSARKRPLRRHAVALALIALAIGSSFLLGKTVAHGDAGEIPYKVAIGFYVWLASMVLAAAAALLYTHAPKAIGTLGEAS
jgi:hypothetical protein